MAPQIHFAQLRECIAAKLITLRLERRRGELAQLLSVVYHISLVFSFPCASVSAWVSTTSSQVGESMGLTKPSVSNIIYSISSFVTGPWFRFKKLEHWGLTTRVIPADSDCWIMQDGRSSFGTSSGSTGSFYWVWRSSDEDNRPT